MDTSDQTPTPVPGHEGETPEFQAFLEASMEGLHRQTAAHQSAWHIGEAEHWDFSQETGELVFTFPEVIARAPAQIIGSFDTRAGTWMWAWANPSIVDALQRDSRQVKDYGEEHGIPRLVTASWPGEELDGWYMTALAARLCEANGAYRGPAGPAFVFFTLGQVQLAKRNRVG